MADADKKTRSAESSRLVRIERPLNASIAGGGTSAAKEENAISEYSALSPPPHSSSASSSPTSITYKPDDNLPTNVSTQEQLRLLPPVCLNDDENTRQNRPLRHVDDLGNEYLYSLAPMSYSVAFILVVELLERFAFYGIYYTMTLFLTGAYNDDWNAGFASVKAASFVSVSTMVAYSTPFIGAFFADSLLGDYKAILFGMLFFYLPGVLLIALTTVPSLLGEEFNDQLLTIGILFLWPLGTGIVKSIVNGEKNMCEDDGRRRTWYWFAHCPPSLSLSPVAVFGAKQYHPVLQSSLIESYYVSFYTTINVGALAGICIIPIIAQHNLTLAYFVPLLLLTGGVASFLLGTPRYVKTAPRNRDNLCHVGLKKRGRQGSTPVTLSPIGKKKTVTLLEILRISVLIVPFCVGYNQMPTTFIVQGTVMSNAFGLINVASMNSLDSISVLFFGYITATYIYPGLNRRGIKIPTTYKFAIGSFLGALAIVWAIFVEHLIHSTYKRTGEPVNVLWQAPSYLLIGFGEIFAVSAAYEVAFTASPPDKKVLSSATNIFCVGGLPNMICIVLYHSCSHWFANDRGTTNINYLEDYSTAHVGKYFGVLLVVMGLGIFINVLPWVREYVESIEDRASDLVKTPHIGKSPPLRQHDVESTSEGAPLIITPRTRKYQEYLQYGSGPSLARSGSMRAGPSLSRSDLPGGHVKNIKYNMIPKLYRGGGAPDVRRVHVATDATGRPIRAGDLAAAQKKAQLLQAQKQHQQQQPRPISRQQEQSRPQGLNRHNSMS